VPTISLPMDPDLGQLRKKAREFQRAVRSGDPHALALVAEFRPAGPPSATFRLPGEDLAAAFLRLSCGGYPTTNGGDHARDLRGARPASAAPPTARHEPGSRRRVRERRGGAAHLANDPALATRASEPYGWPPLLYQASARHDPHAGLDATMETARLLLAAGADPNDDSATVLEYDEHDDLLELLLEFGLGRDTNGPWRRLLGDQLASPAAVLRELLFFAIERDRRDRVTLLARHGVDLASPFTDLSFEDPHNWPAGTPAAVALVNGNRELARQLADLGAPLPEPASPDGFIAAVLAGDAAAVRSADPAAVADLLEPRTEA
jgi:hypothetical protein